MVEKIAQVVEKDGRKQKDYGIFAFMKKWREYIKQRGVILFITHISIYLMLVGAWSLVAYVTEEDHLAMIHSISINAIVLFMLLMVYLLNFYFLVPMFFEPKGRLRRGLFALFNMGYIMGVNVYLVFPSTSSIAIPIMRAGYYQFFIIWVMLNYAMVVAAILGRYFLRQSDLKAQLMKEKQKNMESELAWLKNQLNPHFLFNTLNNISSLTQIDADEAQNAIGQLSDLLRYALYETQQKEVGIDGEIEFMQNYIGLMSLRCSENVEIKTQFNIVNHHRTIAPMLLLSPIENAFKHGVSNGKPSFVHISLTEDNDTLLFTCKNSNYPKGSQDRSGSGIGIENMCKRLEIIYPKAYEIKQSVENNVYSVSIKLNLKKT